MKLLLAGLLLLCPRVGHSQSTNILLYFQLNGTNVFAVAVDYVGNQFFNSSSSVQNTTNLMTVFYAGDKAQSITNPILTNVLGWQGPLLHPSLAITNYASATALHPDMP